MSFLEEYTLLDELGKGGFATVYKVRHNELDYIRAIRVLNATITDESDPIYRKFINECRILLRLGNGNHPNIVHIYQPLLRAQKAIVEMDYVDGEDISHYISRNKGFVPASDVIRMAQEIGSALAYCHFDIFHSCMDREIDNLQDDPQDGSKVLLDMATQDRLIEKYRVIHNDIHSGNIIRRRDGSYVLLDFGLAIEGGDVKRSARRQHGGAPEYKAPEKWEDDSDLTTESDIYSFGVVLYEMLAGRVPFPFDKSMSNGVKAEYLVGEAHQTQTPEPIEPLRRKAFEAKYPGVAYKKDYPNWLEHLIMRCLAKKPYSRFEDGKDLSDFIKTFHSTINFINHRSVIALQTEAERLRRKLYGTTTVGQGDFTETALGLNMKMIYVDGGTFMMGASANDANAEDEELPQHLVTLSPYYIAEFAVTQAQWQRVMGITVRHQSTLAGFPDNYHIEVGDNYPISFVNWYEASSFCAVLRKLTGKPYRLPTEAEWEFAARGGEKSRGYTFSGSNSADSVAWHADNSNSQIHPVGQKQPNELGLYDMSGNVNEWCLDIKNSYPSEPQLNPECRTVDDFDMRVARGGSSEGDMSDCSVTRRNCDSPTNRFSDFGFRVVCLINKQ